MVQLIRIILQKHIFVILIFDSRTGSKIPIWIFTRIAWSAIVECSSSYLGTREFLFQFCCCGRIPQHNSSGVIIIGIVQERTRRKKGKYKIELETFFHNSARRYVSSFSVFFLTKMISFANECINHEKISHETCAIKCNIVQSSSYPIPFIQRTNPSHSKIGKGSSYTNECGTP